MLFLKLLIAWLVVTAVLAVLQHCGMAPHENENGTTGAEGQGCRFCSAAEACQSAQPVHEKRTNQEDRS